MEYVPGRHVFNRFKYAEEFAHGADERGLKWNMTREPDRFEAEDGEVYTIPMYIVEVET